MRCAFSINHCYQFGPEKQSANVKIEGTEGAVCITLGSMLNYPNFDLQEILKPKRSWTNRLSFGLIGSEEILPPPKKE